VEEVRFAPEIIIFQVHPEVSLRAAREQDARGENPEARDIQTSPSSGTGAPKIHWLLE
jgi:hypothetical protein